MYCKYNNRLRRVRGLLFFIYACAGMAACNSGKEPAAISIGWNGDKAISVTIPWHILPVRDKGVAKANTKIRLEYSNTDILGHFSIGSGLVFEPLIPFVHGQTYRIFYRQTGIGSFTVPAVTDTAAPQVTAVYPQAVTLPMNLLKVYLQFSRPMQENVSAQFVKMIGEHADTLHDVFLDLQPELWNKERTVLTLWLDPGRIKRDLQPNQRMGAPLKEAHRYQLFISPGWKDQDGMPMAQSFVTTFVTSIRDSISPAPASWNISLPAANTGDPLRIGFGKAMDHFLLLETIRILAADGSIVDGAIHTARKDSAVVFTPSHPWKPGSYRLSVDARLEDLAGNNLNRPFDRDLQSGKPAAQQEQYFRDLQIR